VDATSLLGGFELIIAPWHPSERAVCGTRAESRGQGMKTQSLICRFFLIACMTVALAVAAPAAIVEVGNIVKNPAQFDNKIVAIQGTATTVSERISRIGNPYMTSRVQDSTGSIAIYARGHPGISNGDRVEVIGLFQRVKRVGRYTFYNEINVQNIKRLSPD
jgi:hypothetical protein